MAWDDWGDRFSDPDDVYAILWSDDPSIRDEHARELFNEGVFGGNEQAYRDLIDYMWDEYDMDFEDVFDWEVFEAESG